MDNFSHQTNNSSPARANDDLTNLISSSKFNFEIIQFSF